MAFESKALALVLKESQLLSVVGDLFGELGESFERGLHLLCGLFGVSTERRLLCGELALLLGEFGHVTGTGLDLGLELGVLLFDCFVLEVELLELLQQVLDLLLGGVDFLLLLSQPHADHFELLFNVAVAFSYLLHLGNVLLLNILILPFQKFILLLSQRNLLNQRIILHFKGLN